MPCYDVLYAVALAVQEPRQRKMALLYLFHKYKGYFLREYFSNLPRVQTAANTFTVPDAFGFLIFLCGFVGPQK